MNAQLEKIIDSDHREKVINNENEKMNEQENDQGKDQKYEQGNLQEHEEILTFLSYNNLTEIERN
jgi:hypothetical protein